MALEAARTQRQLAIHRAYLGRDGAGKAPIDPQKMMLGPCRGGAVRLAVPGDVLMVGEGIETCLARHAGIRPPRMGGAFDIGPAFPRSADHIRDVIVLADGDDPGEAAARRLRLALEAGGSPRAHRPPAAGDGFQRHAGGSRVPH